MKKILTLGVILGFMLVPLGLKAQVILQIDPATSIPTTISPGQTFSFNLQLVNASGIGVAGYDYALRSVNSGGTPVSGIFTLTGLTITNTTLSSAITSPLTLPAALNPQVGTSGQPIDLGATTPNASTPGLGDGTFNLEQLTLTINANAIQRTYRLELYELPGAGPVYISDAVGNSIGTASTPIFTSSIVVVPEPSTWLLILMGGGLLLLFRRLDRVR